MKIFDLQLYDPLCKFANETCMSRDPAFSAELNDQERKLMDGLKAIMHLCDGQDKTAPKVPSAGTLVTVSFGSESIHFSISN